MSSASSVIPTLANDDAHLGFGRLLQHRASGESAGIGRLPTAPGVRILAADALPPTATITDAATPADSARSLAIGHARYFRSRREMQAVDMHSRILDHRLRAARQIALRRNGTLVSVASCATELVRQGSIFQSSQRHRSGSLRRHGARSKLRRAAQWAIVELGVVAVQARVQPRDADARSPDLRCVIPRASGRSRSGDSGDAVGDCSETRAGSDRRHPASATIEPRRSADQSA